MPSRYVRDELIAIALNMAQVPNLKAHDMPNNVVQPDAYAVQWLQDILDFWYHMVPFSAAVSSTVLNCTAQSDSVTLPSDFILDVRNGYIVQADPANVASMCRLHRVTLPQFLNRKLYYQGATAVNAPSVYCIQGVDADGMQTIKVTPTPTVSTVGELWYYQLPPTLQPYDKPRFPSDYAIIEYIRIRSMEWCGAIEPGTAQKFCDTLVKGMKAAGLMNEPEEDNVPFDELMYRRAGQYGGSTYGWMGPI